MIKVEFNINSRQTNKPITLSCYAAIQVMFGTHYCLDFGSHSFIYKSSLIKSIKNVA